MTEHDKLLESFALAKGIVFKNCNLGSKWMNDCSYKAPPLRRADLVVIKPSYTQFCIEIIEVKASRQDFLQDKKWQEYLPYCHLFSFACPKGLINRKELPEDVGLWVYDKEKKTWRCSKSGKLREIELNLEFLQALIFYRQKDETRRGYVDSWYRHRPLEKLVEIDHGIKEMINFYRDWGWYIQRIIDAIGKENADKYIYDLGTLLKER